MSCQKCGKVRLTHHWEGPPDRTAQRPDSVTQVQRVSAHPPGQSTWQEACEAGHNAAHRRDWKRDVRKPVPTSYTSRHLRSPPVARHRVIHHRQLRQATELIAMHDDMGCQHSMAPAARRAR